MNPVRRDNYLGVVVVVKRTLIHKFLKLVTSRGRDVREWGMPVADDLSECESLQVVNEEGTVRSAVPSLDRGMRDYADCMHG